MSIRGIFSIIALFLFQSLACSAQADQAAIPSNTRTYHCLIRGDSTKQFTIRYAIIQSVTDSGFYYSAVKHGSTTFEREVRFMPARYIDEMKIGRKGKTGTGILVGGVVGFFVGGVLGLSGVPDYGILESIPPEENALIGGTLATFPGLIIGGIAGSAREKIHLGKDPVTYQRNILRLRRFSKMP